MCLYFSDFLLGFCQRRHLLNAEFPQRFSIGGLFVKIPKITAKGFTEFHDKFIS